MKVITDYTGSSQTRCITIHHADSYKTMCISIRQLGPILWEVDRIVSTDSRGTVRDPWHNMGKVPCPLKEVSWAWRPVFKVTQQQHQGPRSITTRLVNLGVAWLCRSRGYLFNPTAPDGQYTIHILSLNNILICSCSKNCKYYKPHKYGSLLL